MTFMGSYKADRRAVAGDVVPARAIITRNYCAAVERHAHERLVAHEAAHCAAAVLLGLDVERVTAPYWTLTGLGSGDPDASAGECVFAVPPGDDGLRKAAVVTLAAGLEDGDAFWPPKWPVLPVERGDTTHLAEIVDRLDLDERSYAQLVDDAIGVWRSEPFERLHGALAMALERHGHLDRRGVALVKALAEGTPVEHLLLKANTTTVTDQGEFEAVISTATVDRERDVVDPAAMVTALRKWTGTGKLIPLAWNHSTRAEDQIGHVDPGSAGAQDGEVVVRGWVDQGTEMGRHAWRLVKSGTLGFSFGFLVLDSSPRKGGGRHITGVDIFEVTATTTPMNADTRVLGWKSATATGDDDGVRDRYRDELLAILDAPLDAAGLRAKCDHVAQQNAPVRVKTFKI